MDYKSGTIEYSIILLSAICDGAIALDGQGWNSRDTIMGHSLARQLQAGRYLSDKQKRVVVKMLPKYHRQIPEFDKVLEQLKEWGESLPQEGELLINFDNPIVREISPEELRPKLDYNEKENKFYLYTRPQHNTIAQGIHSPRWIGPEKAWRYLNNEKTLEGFIQNKEFIEYITPAAMEQLMLYLDDLANEKLAKVRVQEIKQGKLDPSLKLPVKLKPYKHQVTAFQVGITLKNPGYFMEPGTGKSLPTIALAGYRFLNKEIDTMFIACPLSAVTEWDRMFGDTASFPYELVCVTDADGMKEQLAQKPIDGKLRVLVTTYDIIRQNLVEKTKRTTRVCRPFITWIKNSQGVMAVLDESHLIKNRTKQRAKACHKIRDYFKYRTILSGTPIPNIAKKPMEVYSQLEFLDKNILGTPKEFKEQHCVMKGYNGRSWIAGIKNIEELIRKINSVTYRITLDECEDIPKPEDHIRLVNLEPEAMALYREMKKESIIELGNLSLPATIILTKYLRLQQITGGFVTLEDKVYQLSQAKLKVLDDDIDTLLEEDDDRKIVIFAKFKPEILAISKLMTEKKLSHSVLMGKTLSGKKLDSKARGEMIKDFQEGPTKILVVQIATGGAAITLTRADVAIFYSLDYNFINYYQARARIRRISQQRTARYIHLVAKGTIDEKVLKILREKEALARIILDDSRALEEKEATVGKLSDFKGDMRIIFGEDDDTMAKKQLAQKVDVTKFARAIDHDETDELNELLGELEEQLKSNSRSHIIELKGEDEDIKIDIQPIHSKSQTSSTKKAGNNTLRRKTGNTRAKEISQNDTIITVKDLADELNTDPRKLRRWLRENLGQAEGRWEWADDDPVLERIRKKFVS